MRHVLITGGSSGIGLALAQRVVQAGASVSLIARDPGKLTAAKEMLTPDLRAGSKVVLAPADVGDRVQAETACAAAVEQIGPPDLAILNAGQAVPGHFCELDPQIFEEMMRVNYFGALWCSRALISTMAPGGRLVFVSSGAALTGIFGYTAYGPSKFAMRGLAEALRAELRPRGIGVSIAYPPDTDTPQLAAETAAKPVETRAITASGGVMSADRVARSILAGTAANRFAITPGITIWALAWGHSLLAPLLRWWFDRVARRARAKEGR